MKTFCTVSDYNYLNQGLVLYESLVKHCPLEFKLYYLCIDKKAYDKLVELNLDHIIPQWTGYIPTLTNSTNIGYAGYCWSLGCRYTQYICDTFKPEEIMYIDSDIVFYPGIKNIYEEIGTRSIAIIPHLHISVGSGPGGYNVGIVYFKNNKPGKICLDFWVDCVMGKRPEHKNPNKIGRAHV